MQIQRRPRRSSARPWHKFERLEHVTGHEDKVWAKVLVTKVFVSARKSGANYIIMDRSRFEELYRRSEL